MSKTCIKQLYGLKMAVDIRFNRELTEQDYVIPGGYTMVFSGRSISFDFSESSREIDPKDSTILHCEMNDPDFSAFEDFRSVTTKELRNVSEIEDCYVYIGEECDTELSVTEILAITFWPADEDSVDISDDVIMKYNENMKG